MARIPNGYQTRFNQCGDFLETWERLEVKDRVWGRLEDQRRTEETDSEGNCGADKAHQP